MRAVDLIRKKRDNGELSADEIAWLIASPDVEDYQWSALLMAIVWRGMNAAETSALTDAMMRSGSVVDLGSIPGPKVDKHSTGGVGDKTSLILAPIAAACGVNVPMVSGRGLGHTGGTLDKLESIPGFSVNLDLNGYRRVLRECGLVLIGQTKEIAPADKRLYQLRDATATVESIALITASILSKKLAEGIDGLVLDVKTGNGAFMQTLDESRELARAMVTIGRRLGKEVVALITRMDQPLGRAVGNALEVRESVQCLRGEGPADLIDLSLELAAEMVQLAGVANDHESALTACREAIASGAALDRLRRVVGAQGGEVAAIDDPARLPAAKHRIELRADRAGYVRSLAARPIGHAAMLLGAGRGRVDSSINPAVGVWLDAKVGDRISAGDRLCTVYTDDLGGAFDDACRQVKDSYDIGDAPVDIRPLIVERL